MAAVSQGNVRLPGGHHLRCKCDGPPTYCWGGPLKRPRRSRSLSIKHHRGEEEGVRDTGKIRTSEEEGELRGRAHLYQYSGGI